MAKVASGHNTPKGAMAIPVVPPGVRYKSKNLTCTEKQSTRQYRSKQNVNEENSYRVNNELENPLTVHTYMKAVQNIHVLHRCSLVFGRNSNVSIQLARTRTTI